MAQHPLLHLPSSLPIAVQRAEDESKTRYLGHFIGTHQMGCVLVGGFSDEEFAVGEDLVARMISGGEAIGFRTRVQAIVPEPRIYLLDFPAQVQSFNLRKSERIAVFFPADLQIQRDASGEQQLALLNAMVVDLSAGGCSLTTKRPVKGGTEVRVGFILPGERFKLSLVGKVIDSAPHETAYVQRVRFSESNENLGQFSDISRWVQLNSGFATP